MGKEEIARNEQFLLFPKCFLLNQEIVFPFLNIFNIISLFAAELQEPKTGMWGKDLKVWKYIFQKISLVSNMIFYTPRTINIELNDKELFMDDNNFTITVTNCVEIAILKNSSCLMPEY